MRSTQKKARKINMNKKKNNVLTLISLLFLLWIMASYVNTITNNVSAGEDHTYASWNCFDLLSDLD